MDNPIEALLNNDPNGFRETIGDILAQKLADRIETERADIASRLFAGDEASFEGEDGQEYESGEDADV